MQEINNMSPKSFAVGTVVHSPFTSLVSATSGFSFYSIQYCSHYYLMQQIFNVATFIQTLLQHLSGMFQLLK
jgi:hypothetical protein